MTNMESRHKETLGIAEQAAQWLLVMQSPGPDERAAFWQWLEESPSHVREIILAARVQQRLHGFDRERRIDIDTLIAKGRANIATIGTSGTTSTEVRPNASGNTTVRRRWYAAAASIAAAASLIAVLAIWEGRDTYATAVGQQLVFELDDGSVVSLNTRSRLKLRFSHDSRDLYLPSGQALFDVKRDPNRPFRVHTASSVVEAVGTQFDVRVFDGGTRVSVVEGAVKIEAQEQTRLSAGETATVNAAGEIDRPSTVDVATISAWKQQQLIFNEETLGWIVDEFNRYNATIQLRVEGESLRSRRFNGVFNAHSPESLVEYLEHDPAIAFEREADRIVIRAKAPDTAEPSDR